LINILEIRLAKTLNIVFREYYTNIYNTLASGISICIYGGGFPW